MSALERYNALRKINPILADIHLRTHGVAIQLELQAQMDAQPAPPRTDLPPIPLFDKMRAIENPVQREIFRVSHRHALEVERAAALKALAQNAAAPDAPNEEPAT